MTRPPGAPPAPGDGVPVLEIGPEQPGLTRLLDGLRIGMVLLGVALATLIGLPLQWLSLSLKLPSRRLIPALYHRILLKLLGVRVTIIGAPAPGRPLLLLANHVSWLDICVVGSLTPLFFVAKSEVSGWPLIGLLAKFQRTIFVNRNRRSATGTVNQEIAARLGEGDPVVLFAEGTSSDGNRILPFRTALVGAVREAFATAGTVTVQPLAVTYTRIQGVPMGRRHRPLAAWYGDMDLAPHLMAVLRQGALDVEVRFGSPMALDSDHDRKSVTRAAEAEVRRLNTHAIVGRNEPA
ncbi:1-acyl-sn-glycerol-3-phosphate acyltransferase [Azorhizobium oxalatiphilum]|uniref:1-acyl-sn-glycerol-3-phosphate acyltransferase n=1 Tax=Azorhizobium oxalatiphilum TaxID=980631 RepID=A0A917CD33_9HYPH|nr:lysophospholipid acyltransferase family protein [Azorhizobium oxalatiphilum]GGF79994.1 1-acyl-sn-glycerol-3-phosphate acyltransferase [Azorhizobium oxalatiphilum]